MPPGDSSEQRIRESILDRLIDDDVHSSRDAPQTARQILRSIRNSVRRDLENLLNTRWRCEAWPPDLVQLEQSLVDYGIPDFASFASNVAEKPETLLAQIGSAIERFEPRLKNVRLEMLEKGNRDRIFEFRVSATLHVEPFDDEPILLESSLEPSSGDFRVNRPSR